MAQGADVGRRLSSAFRATYAAVPRTLRRDGAIVLAYHRVAAPRRDPQQLCVQPDRFREHLEALTEVLDPQSVSSITDAVARRQQPRGFAVTFDDGYADNLYAAKPLLAQLEIPATVFVASGYIGGSREFWWDELDRIVLSTSSTQRRLTLRVGRREITWTTEANSPDGSESRSVYREIFRILRTAGADAREDVMRQVRSWASSESRDEHQRTMTADELVELTGDGLVSLGAHTVEHTNLGSLDIGRQRQEVIESRRALELILGREVRDFAYPFGRRRPLLHDYDSNTIAVVKEAGFRSAFTTNRSLVSRDSHLHQLPRLTVRDWDGDRLIAEIRRSFPNLLTRATR